MPKLTLLLGRRTMQVYDFKQPSIVIGRDEGVDVMIDNPSVSRRHAEIRLSDNGWVVEDLGSSNGTFIRGTKIQGPQTVGLGDEIGFGKFSIVFGKALGEGEHAPPPPGAPTAKAAAVAAVAATQGTMHINPHEVRELLKDADRKKRAHLVWESGGERGTHYLSEAPAILIGTDELCDVRVPKGPKHHVLIVRSTGGTDVRYLATFGSMTVRGEKTERTKLKNGDVVEAGGLTITFVDDVA
ncbi:MAG: FHA domain-containing protein [Longimicrobiales bacterium]